MNLQGKIELIKESVIAIKNAILSKNVTPSGNVSTYTDAINNIVTPNNQTKTVTENGVVRYDIGYTGLEQVTVNVSQSVQDKTINTNGSYTADSGYIGLGTVTVDVFPDVTTKTITANGIYNAEDDNVDGYSNVTVNVSSPINDLIDGSITSVDTNVSTIKSGAFKDCEDLETVILRSNTVVDLSDDSIFENTPIADKIGNIYVPSNLIANYKNSYNSWEQSSKKIYSSFYHWCGMTYAKNKFFALDNTGAIFYSDNGNSWTDSSTRLGSNISWGSIASNGTNIVVIGTKFENSSYKGYISISTDGINWSEPTVNLVSPNSGYWNTLTYGNDRFIALSSSGYISISTNGTTWASVTQNANLGNNSWRALAYGNNKFVALGNSGYISTSTDGTTWTTATQNANLGSHNWHSISYGNNIFIAIGSTSNTSTQTMNGYFSTSINGTTWTTAYNPEELNVPIDSGYWNALAYDNDEFLALNEGGYTSKYESVYNFLPIS